MKVGKITVFMEWLKSNNKAGNHPNDPSKKTG